MTWVLPKLAVMNIFKILLITHFIIPSFRIGWFKWGSVAELYTHSNQIELGVMYNCGQENLLLPSFKNRIANGYFTQHESCSCRSLCVVCNDNTGYNTIQYITLHTFCVRAPERDQLFTRWSFFKSVMKHYIFTLSREDFGYGVWILKC